MKTAATIPCSFCTGSGWIIGSGKDWEKKLMGRCEHCSGTGKLPNGAETEIKILEEAIRLIESGEIRQWVLEDSEQWVLRALNKATETVNHKGT